MDEAKHSFWNTTTGLIAAVAGLLTALTGIVALAVSLSDRPSPQPTGSSAPSLTAWASEVNEVCSGYISTMADAFEIIDTVEVADDPVLGQALRQASLNMAALLSELNSLASPDDPRATEWHTLYLERGQHVVRASERWDSGDILGSAESFAASSSADTQYTIDLGASIGIVSCP